VEPRWSQGGTKVEPRWNTGGTQVANATFETDCESVLVEQRNSEISPLCAALARSPGDKVTRLCTRSAARSPSSTVSSPFDPLNFVYLRFHDSYLISRFASQIFTVDHGLETFAGVEKTQHLNPIELWHG